MKKSSGVQKFEITGVREHRLYNIIMQTLKKTLMSFAAEKWVPSLEWEIIAESRHC